MKESFLVSIVSFAFSEASPLKSLVRIEEEFVAGRRVLWRWSRVLTSISGFYLCLLFSVPSESADRSPTFEAHVRPIFEARCVACHWADSPQQGLDLRSAAAIMKGGKSGPAIQPGSSSRSLLLEKTITKQMPPTELQKKYAVRPPTEGELN